MKITFEMIVLVCSRNSILLHSKAIMLFSHKLYDLSTANGVPLPGIHGAVASGIASGDLLGGCARGDINSMTFVFNDGTISTTTISNGSTTDDSNNSLGYISTPTGNPCIPGKLHTDAAVFLGAQVGFGAMQGYANSISNSQYMQGANASGQTFTMLMGNADKAAAGQALSSGAEAAQTWWNQRVQSSHDFVYVSNVKGGHPRKVVAMRLIANSHVCRIRILLCMSIHIRLAVVLILRQYQVIARCSLYQHVQYAMPSGIVAY